MITESRGAGLMRQGHHTLSMEDGSLQVELQSSMHKDHEYVRPVLLPITASNTNTHQQRLQHYQIELGHQCNNASSDDAEDYDDEQHINAGLRDQRSLPRHESGGWDANVFATNLLELDFIWR